VYTAADLKPFLQQRYDRAEWVPVLRQLFGFERTEFFAPTAVAELAVSESIADRVAAMRQFGYVELGEPTFLGPQHRLALVEVELKTSKTLIARNRVGLRALTYPYVDGVQAHGVLAFYYDPEQADYRLSFQTKLAQGRGTSSVPDFVGTERRRYTFVLGPHEAARTAADRLSELGRRAGRTTLDNVLEAFSVERLGSDFFKRYKSFYEEFIKHLNSSPEYRGLFKLDPKPRPEAKLLEPEEKPLRDFVKRLLGRLVFLHFLQKKGWMGCTPDRPGWDGGSSEFLLNLFRPFREAGRADFHSAALAPLFFETLSLKRKDDLFQVDGMRSPCRVPYLNGGLFEEDEIEARRIEFPAELFGRLLDFFAQYNFTIEENRPEDHDVGIDPEMLGHIFENLLEENRTKGAIYTPRPIVRYMCQESLIGYLHGRLEKDGIDRDTVAAFVREHDVRKPLRERAMYLEKLLEDVRICDPAIGSGAFPIGLLQELFAARLYLYPHLSDERRRRFDPAQVKKDIVAHNIYGVDFDSGAVDIARLRFWLALVVDEPDPVPLPNLDFKVMQGNSLLESFEGVDLSHISDPDAGDGDTLVLAEGPQYELGVEFSKRRQPLLMFSGKKKTDLLTDITEFFEASAERKRALREQIRATVDAYLHAEMKRERLRLQDDVQAQEAFLNERLGLNYGALLKPTSPLARKYQRSLEALAHSREKEAQLLEQHSKPDRPYFLWHLYFKDVFDRGGFDIVIANPPYMRVQEIEQSTPKLKPFYEAAFPRVTKGAYDLANLFVLHTVEQLLHPKGVACVIFPHKFFNSNAGESFRDILLEKGYLRKVAHFGTNRLFNEADTFVCVATLTQSYNAAFGLQMFPYRMPPAEINTRLQDDSLYESVTLATIKEASEAYGENSWLLLKSKAEYELFQMLYANSPAHFAEVIQIYQGVPTSNDKLYQVRVAREDDTHIWAANDLEPERLWQLEKRWFRPMVRGRDVQRYEPLHYDVWVFFPYRITDGKDEIVSLSELETDYPLTNRYVLNYEADFKARERGKARHMAHWHGYIYPRNMNRYDLRRISSMEICTLYPNVTINEGYCHNTKVYSWELKHDAPVQLSYEFLLALGNSKLLWWFLKRTGDTLKDDARTLKTNYLNPFPLPPLPPGFIIEALEDMVRMLLWLHDAQHPVAVPNLPNSAVADLFRDVVDLGVCELYLGLAMAEKQLDILTTVAQDILMETAEAGAAETAAVILRLFRRWQRPDSIVRNRLQLATVRLPEWLGAVFSV
jgi:hypothetical protein